VYLLTICERPTLVLLEDANREAATVATGNEVASSAGAQTERLGVKWNPQQSS
jgi:hypothetical protein